MTVWRQPDCGAVLPLYATLATLTQAWSAPLVPRCKKSCRLPSAGGLYYTGEDNNRGLGPTMTTASLHAVARYVRHLSEQDTRALSDFQLLDRFTTHQDEAAFTELVRRHGPMVLGVCRRVLNNGHDAEDAFQAAFLVLVRKAASIRQHDAISGWLYRVAYRLALRARARRSRTEKREGRIDEAILDPRPSILDPHSELEEEVQRLQ